MSLDILDISRRKIMEDYDLFVCSCHDVNHQFIISYDKLDNDEVELVLSVHLSKLPFFTRLIYGIKYIFGFQSRFGAFNEIILDENQIKRLISSLNKTIQKETIGE